MSSASSSKTQNEYKVLVKCDEPVKQATLVIPASATFAKLKEMCAKTLDLKESVVARYSFFNVAFGHDIVPLGIKGDNEVLVETGLRDRSALFVRAPVDIKPLPERKVKKVAEDDEAAGYDPDRFAGLTPKNVLAKLAETKVDNKKKKLMLEFVETFTGDILKESKSFNQLPTATLIEILKDDKLTCKEVDLFDAVLGWSKSEVERASKSSKDGKADQKSVLKDVLPHIRFPVMGMSDVATKVTISGLLSSEQILALYTYIGMKPQDAGSDAKLPKLPPPLKEFSQKERKGATRAPVWDPTQYFTYNIYTCTNKNKTALKAQQNGTVYILRELEPRTKGLHIIRVRCDASSQHDQYNNDGIGFANDNYSWTSACMNGNGASFVNGTGQVYCDNTVRTNSSWTINTGNILTFTLDMDKRTVTYQNSSNNNTPTKVDWYAMGQRVYFSMCWRQNGWQFTIMD